MGVLVPHPPPLPATWERDEHGHLHYLARRWPWLCLYCHTVQPANKLACCNCGAPKQQIEARP